MIKSDKNKNDFKPTNLSGLVITGWTLAAGLSLAAVYGAYQSFLKPVPLDRVVVQVAPDQRIDRIQTGSIPTTTAGDNARIVATLEKQAADLQREISAFRRTSASLRQENTVLNQRIARLEALVGDVTGSIPDAGTTSVSQQALTSSIIGDQAFIEAEVPFPIDPPTVVNAETIPGAFAPDALGKTPDQRESDIIAGRSQFAVDLGGFQSLASLEEEWRALSARDYAALKSLSPRAALKDTDSRLSLRLLAGPFRNAVEAATVCARLRVAGLVCSTSVFHGQMLKDSTTARLTDGSVQ